MTYVVEMALVALSFFDNNLLAMPEPLPVHFQYFDDYMQALHALRWVANPYNACMSNVVNYL